MRPLNLLGKRFGKLTVIGQEPTSTKGQTMWLARCKCGRTLVLPSHITKYRSCGCSKIRHGNFIGARHTNAGRAYYCWTSMIQRCTNQKSTSYKNYGARGVTVCARWRHSFANFLSDLGPRPPGTSLDRHPDRTGNYVPGNVRWATPTEQNRNKRNSKLTRDMVTEILRRLARKETQVSIAAHFAISHNHVSKLWRGILWSELARPWLVTGRPVPRFAPAPSNKQKPKQPRCSPNKITRKTAQKILDQLRQGISQVSIAKQHGLRPRHVSALYRGNIWRDLKRPWLFAGRPPHFNTAKALLKRKPA